MMEYYVSIHMTVVTVLVALMFTIFIYGISLFIRGMWPHLNVRMGVFYVLIAILWLGTSWLLIN
jgi:hypothetical protein